LAAHASPIFGQWIRLKLAPSVVPLVDRRISDRWTDPPGKLGLLYDPQRDVELLPDGESCLTPTATDRRSLVT
jgi:hypothetical protein